MSCFRVAWDKEVESEWRRKRFREYWCTRESQKRGDWRGGVNEEEKEGSLSWKDEKKTVKEGKEEKKTETKPEVELKEKFSRRIRRLRERVCWT